MFVTFEGPEGAGKSTAIRAISNALQAEGQDVLVTREPGAGNFGAAVRRLLLEGEPVCPTAELFLFLADRAEHMASIVRPALDRGAIVLCDRHADSTVVYQGHARGLDLEELRRLNAIATAGLKPDLTLLFDIEPEIGLARLQSKDRLDREPIEFHRKVRQGFLYEARLEPERWEVLDASAPSDSVSETALRLVRSRL